MTPDEEPELPPDAEAPTLAEETPFGQTQSVKGDKYDAQAYLEGLKQAANLRTDVAGHQKRLATVNQLAEDLFRAMFKLSPQVHAEEAMDDTYAFNRELVQRAIGTEEYDKLRAYTKLEEVESLVATRAVLMHVMDNLPKDEMKEVNDGANEANAAQDEMQKLANQLQGLQQAMQGQPQTVKSRLKQQTADAKAKYQKAQQKRQKATQRIKKATDGMATQMRAVVRQGMAKANEQTDNLKALIETWGSETGQVQRLPTDEKFRLAQLLERNTRLQALARLAGRLRRLALAKQRTKIRNEPSEVVGIQTGDDLERVLPEEFMDLIDPDTEVLFLKRFVEQELLQTEVHRKVKVAKGPIIVCIDNSGSMAGDPDTWAKAVFIALSAVAARQRREAHVIAFGGPKDPLKEWRFQKKMGPNERLNRTIEVAEYFLGGGTDFQTPLDAAMNAMGDLPKADIIFISDGECDVTDKWEARFKQAKKEREFRMYSVLIGGQSDVLKRLSDRVLPLSDIGDDGDSVAGEIFEAV